MLRTTTSGDPWYNHGWGQPQLLLVLVEVVFFVQLYLGLIPTLALCVPHVMGKVAAPPPLRKAYGLIQHWLHQAGMHS